ncbi:MAG TPA: SDR family NAD(P)-dependent oxidoreductase [Solirubrobacteraceae bacterium]|nr:SDR family NAD(P)-dependent oxidoreductase [Solirubrobacteraceae bacterium]
MNLAGRSVLLTGATGGIGHAIARAVAARGGRLLVSGRRADVLEPLATELGGRALPCDLADPAELDRLVAEAAAVDVLIANAALPASGALETFTVEEIDRALAVNLRAPMILARHLGESMAARGAGHLVFISSISGKVASHGSAVYSATKFGLRGFALGLREDLRSRGVGVSTVFPGFISGAGMFHEADVRLPGYVGTKTPQQVADAVIGAIENNRAEVDVAPLGLRAGAAIAGLAPEVSARLQRRLGSERVATALAAAQRGKR